jgi:hypothetical protein
MIAEALHAISFYLTLSGGVSLLLILAFYLALLSFSVYTFVFERLLQHFRLYKAFTAFVIYVYRGGANPKEDE